MSNKFTNTGWATILPKQSQGVFSTLLHSQRQLQQSKAFQAKEDDDLYRAKIIYA